jgi:hypothetical protein
LFRRLLVPVAALVLVIIVGGFLAVRWALDPSLLKSAAESRLSAALGLPVTIGTVRVSFFPTIAVTGTNIAIVGAARAAGTSLDIRAIHMHPRLSSIFHRPVVIDRVELDGLTLQARRDASGRWILPLPQMPAAAETAPQKAAFDVSEVLLKNGRLTIAESRAAGTGVNTKVVAPLDNMSATVHRVGGATRLDALTASVGHSTVAGSGSLDARGLRLSLSWRDLDAADLPLVFALVGTPAPAGLSIEGKNPLVLDLTVDSNGNVAASGKIAADSAALGTLAMTDFRSPVAFANNRLALSQMAFRAYSGTGAGRVSANVLASPVTWSLDADLQHLDVDQFLTENTTAKDKVTGTGALQARLRGSSAAPVERTVAGTVAVSIADGTIRNFPLLAAVYSAFKVGAGGRDLDFQSLTGTFTVADARATATDLTVRGRDLTMTASGTLGFDQSLAMSGTVLFSAAKAAEFVHSVKELSALRNANGELPVPFTVSGTAADPHFSIDVADLLRRGAQNELKRRLGEKIRGLIKRIR